MAGAFRRTRHLLAYTVVRLFLLIPRLLPRQVGLFLFALWGRFLGRILIPYRRDMLNHLTGVFGDEKTSAEKQKIISGVFGNLGMTLYDAIKLPSLSQEKFRTIVRGDVTHFKKALDEEKGAIALGSHLGCFELQPQFFVYNDLPCITIGAPLFDKRIDSIVENMRGRNGVTYLHRDGVGRKLIKELKSNKVFMSLIDQDATKDGVFAHFLGKLAFTPTGPIRIALKFDIPMMFMAMERKKDLTYEFHFSDPVIVPNTGDPQKDLIIVAEQYNDYISAQIRKCPEQWVWMHKRWKRERDDFPDTLSIDD